jgi:homoserine dehydrogenase
MSRLDDDGSLYVRTAPFLVPEEHPLHNVSGVFNAVFIHGNMVDNLMFYGRGAGKYPTASAVVADVMDCARNIGRNIPVMWTDEVKTLADPMAESRQFFVRVDSSEKELAMALFRGAQEVLAEGMEGEFAFVTEEQTEAEFERKTRSLKTLKNRIRLLDLGK